MEQKETVGHKTTETLWTEAARRRRTSERFSDEGTKEQPPTRLRGGIVRSFRAAVCQAARVATKAFVEERRLGDAVFGNEGKGVCLRGGCA